MDNKTYMWPQANNETPMVGRKVQVKTASGTRALFNGLKFLMLPLYGNVAEWVSMGDLQEYIGGKGT